VPLKARPLSLLLLTLAVAACHKQAPQKGNVSGEILPGSASDAMIPEDRLTSQPPLDPGAVRHADRGAEHDGTEAAQEDAAAAPAAAETKAAE
jgi:hypothetical protein